MKKALWLVLFLLPVVGRAQDVRGVRLSYVQGDVKADGVALPVNAPLLEGTQLATGEDGQAEIEFEDGSVVRLTPNSSMSLDKLTLDGKNYKTVLTLKSGLTYVELRATEQYGYAVMAGGVTMRPVENSTVRVNLDDGAPAFAVMQGRVEVVRDSDYKAEVFGQETLAVDAGNAARYLLAKQVADDSWDRWNEERDQLAANEAATRTVARDEFAGERGDGWSDLDANGNWYETEQGRAWQPAIANDYGFDPYGYGTWVWYGGDYQWVSGYNWGWVPYHCGRWVYVDGWGWMWYPSNACRRWDWNSGIVIDVTGAPRGYNPIRKPVGNPIKGPAGIHPIAVVPVRRDEAKKLPGHAGPIHTIVADGSSAKQPMHRLEPIAGYAPNGGSAIGAPLRRDFPLGGAREPVMGRAPEESTRRRSEPTVIAPTTPMPTDPIPHRVGHVPVQPVAVEPVQRVPQNVHESTRAKEPRQVQTTPVYEPPPQPRYQPPPPPPQPQPRYEPPPQHSAPAPAAQPAAPHATPAKAPDKN